MVKQQHQQQQCHSFENINIAQTKAMFTSFMQVLQCKA
jgi:hypothetical protein